MLRKLLLGMLAVVLVLLGVVATRPDFFRIERSAEVHASPKSVFDLLNDLHRWPTWSPWEKLDPNLQREYSGAAQGVGAEYRWAGNSEVGRGQMTITGSKPGKEVELRLEFLEPWAAINTTRFLLEPNGDATRVTWVMEGPNDFMAKAASLFMDMDKLIGKDFELGLSNLNVAAQASGLELTHEQAP